MYLVNILVLLVFYLSWCTTQEQPGTNLEPQYDHYDQQSQIQVVQDGGADEDSTNSQTTSFDNFNVRLDDNKFKFQDNFKPVLEPPATGDQPIYPFYYNPEEVKRLPLKSLPLRSPAKKKYKPKVKTFKSDNSYKTPNYQKQYYKKFSKHVNLPVKKFNSKSSLPKKFNSHYKQPHLATELEDFSVDDSLKPKRKVKDFVLEGDVELQDHQLPSFSGEISDHSGFAAGGDNLRHHNPHHGGGNDRVEFQMHNHNGPDSYKFGYDTGKGHGRHFRYEERDHDGKVRGHYGFYDKDGTMRMFKYEADPHTGFHSGPVEQSPDF